MKTKKYSYENNIHISIDTVRLDKLLLPLGTYTNPDGRQSVTSLGIGHETKATIKDDILCVKAPAKIVVELYKKGTMVSDLSKVYEIKIFNWTGRCTLTEILYGTPYGSNDENVSLFFKILDSKGEAVFNPKLVH